MTENLGLFLKDLRTRNGYTQKELADILIVTPQTISKWELNYSTPSLEILLEMSKLYGVTTDEIITCKLKKRIKEEKPFGVKNILIYGMYLLMLAIGISLVFVDYFSVLDLYLVNGLLDVNIHEGQVTYPITIPLDQYAILVLSIFIPIVLLVLKLIDQKKIVYLTTSALFAVVFLAHLLPMIYSTYFIAPNIGLVLHMVYILLLVLSSLIAVGEMGINLYDVIMKYPLEFVGVGLMIIISMILPRAFYQFDLYGDMYYFSFSEEILLNILFITPVIVIFKNVRPLKNIVQVYASILVIAIIFLALVYVFNSGLIFVGILLFSYLTVLAIFFQEELKNFKFDFGKIVLPLSLYVVDAIIFFTYLYLYLNNGDLFNRAGYSIRINDTVIGMAVYFMFFIYLGAMGLRYARVKMLSRLMYVVFTIYVFVTSYLLIDEYFFNKTYTVTDGILFLVPPIVLTSYFILHMLYAINRAITNKDVSYLNPFLQVK